MKLMFKGVLYILPYIESEIIPQVIDTGHIGRYQYCIVDLGSHPCAYVRIPNGHPFKKISFARIESEIDAHGGITYMNQNQLLGGMLPGKGFWIGWDYAHSGDYYGSGYLATVGGKRWLVGEIFKEVMYVVKQLKNEE